MDFLSNETKGQGPERKDSKKSSVPQKALARRQKRETEIRKEKRSMAFKRRRVTGSDGNGVASNHQVPWNEAMIIEAVDSLREVGSENCAKGLWTLRSALCATDPPIQVVVDRGCVPSLIQLLRLPNLALQSDAVWCLTNIASGTHEQTGHVLEAVPDLLMLIGGDDKSLGEQACWAVGNIAGDSDDCRMTMVNNGAVLPLMKFLFDTVNGIEESVGVAFNEAAMMQAQTAAWSLSNLTRGSTPAAVFLETGMIPFLISLIGHPSVTLAIEIWWIFTFLTAKEDIAVQQLLDMGLIKTISAAAASIDPQNISSIPLIRTMGNLSSGPEHWIDFLLGEPPIINCLMICTDQDITNRAVLKETTWVLTNLMGGTEHQRRLMLNANILEKILSLFYSDYFDVQREAVFAIRHACQSAEVLMQIIGDGAEDLLLQLIKFMSVPDEEVRVSGLEIISALIFVSPETKNQVVQLCINFDLIDILENYEYGPGDGRLKQTINTLIGELDAFEGILEDECEDSAAIKHGADFEMDLNDSFTDNSNRVARSRGIDNKPSWMSRGQA